MINFYLLFKVSTSFETIKNNMTYFPFYNIYFEKYKL